MTRVTLKMVIAGRVQGVSFRVTMRERAVHHKVDGWVRNKGDGSVEALVQGEEDHVSSLLEWARVGPSGARVSSVTHEKLDSYPRQTGFRIVE
jgi:acylphosphatase